MESLCAVYVDAGYVDNAAAVRASGTSPHAAVSIDYESVIHGIIEHATHDSARPLLRVHWYDSAHHGVPDDTHHRISQLPKVLLGLGRSGGDGTRKGIDLRLGLDLVWHAYTKAATVLYLVTGTEDLSVAVTKAREHQPGVQINIVAIPDGEGHPYGVSAHLHSVADEVNVLAEDILDAAITPRLTRAEQPPPVTPSFTGAPSPALFATRTSRHSPPETAPPTRRRATEHPIDNPVADTACSTSTGTRATVTRRSPSEDELDRRIKQVVQHALSAWLDENPDERLGELRANRPSIPPELDRTLLMDLSAALGHNELPEKTRHELRTEVWKQIDHK